MSCAQVAKVSIKIVRPLQVRVLYVGSKPMRLHRLSDFLLEGVFRRPIPSTNFRSNRLLGAVDGPEGTGLSVQF